MRQDQRNIIIKLTSYCNLNCYYCFDYKKNKLIPLKIKNRLSNKEAIYTLINRSDISNIILTGGEPILFLNKMKIIEYMNNKSFSILTNGIEKFKGDKKLIEKAKIIVSLDGNEKVMKYCRGVNKESFDQIINNIKWYLISSESVVIHTVLSSININEQKYFPFEKFGVNARYEISMPSFIFTPKKFAVLQNQYLQAKNLILYYEKLYNYKMKCFFNVMSKKTFFFNMDNIIKGMINVEYIFDYNIFRVLNDYYETIDEAFDSIPNKLNSVKRMLSKYLDNKDDNYLFDPYIIMEYLLFKNMLK